MLPNNKQETPHCDLGATAWVSLQHLLNQLVQYNEENEIYARFKVPMIFLDRLLGWI